MLNETRNKWVGVDVDGVLADQVTDLLPLLSALSGDSVVYDDLTEWNFRIGGHYLGELIAAKQTEKDFVLSMRPIPGSVNSIQRLHESYRVAIITARPLTAAEWTKEWLRNHGCPFDAFVCTRDGEKHNLDFQHKVLIDDYLVNVERFLEGTEGIAILFSQPWNHDRSSVTPYIEAGRLHAFSEWENIVEFIETTL